MDTLWWAIGLAAAALTSVSFLPQLVKGLRTKRMDDVSAEMLGLLCVGLFLWLLYGLHRDDVIIIASNVFGLFTVAATLALKLRYSRSK
jgi:MtN3 and saliva related transmembrane protein